MQRPTTMRNKTMNKTKQYIVDSLPEIIRLDKTFDSFSEATGFDLLGFNDAVIIRKKDLVCLAEDGTLTDDMLKVLFENLLAGLDSFYIKTKAGIHKYETFPLDNAKNPFGESNKSKLYGLGRSGFAENQRQFKA